MKSNRYARSLLSLIIASVMIVTMLPVSALAADADVMIEDQAETIVEAAEDVGGEVVEDVSSEVVEETAEVPDIEESTDAAIVTESDDGVPEADSEELTGTTEILSVRADGTLSGSKMYYDAQLTGLSVSAVVPAKRTAEGSYMTADIVDVSAYEDTVAKKNRGNYLSDLYGLELHFYDKKGKEITHINTSDITVTVNAYPAQSYYIGRIDKKLKTIQRGTEAAFTFQEKKAYTYVIAGLMDDGLNRVSAETDGEGNKRFNLNDENVSVEVIAPEDAFADDVSMEASDAINGPAQATEDDDEVLVGASSDEYVAAVEISFYNEDGDEQQPKKDVTVRIAASLDMSKSYKLIHIADNGEKSEVENAVFTEDGVEFTADSFSVYAIEEGETTVTPTVTYHFLDGEGAPYLFSNEAGETVDTQIIKNGEALARVPAPAPLNNKPFVSWKYYDNDAYGDEVVFDTPITVTETADLYIKACYDDVIYLTFYALADGKNDNNEDVVLERITVSKNDENKYTFDMSTVTVTAPQSNLKFMGWSEDIGSSTSETYGDTPGTRTLIANGVVEFTQNKNLYPVFYSGLWITYVSAEVGQGATYIKPYFLSSDQTNASSAEPDPNPDMTGYVFDGWYTADEGTANYPIAEDNTHGSKIDFSSTSFNDLKALDTDNNNTIDLYGHWHYGNTSYVVVYWKQKVTDSKTATVAQKHYDYAGQTEPITALSGSSPTPTAAQKKSAVGFTYARYTLTDGDGNVISSLRPDGDNVLNVYFDRQTVTMRFHKTAGNHGDITGTVYTPYTGFLQGWNEYTHQNWSDPQYVNIYTGLYGQTWQQAGYSSGWPVPHQGNNYNYAWTYFDSTARNNQNWLVWGGDRIMTGLGQFILPNDVKDPDHLDIRLFMADYSAAHVSFYLEDENGTYPQAAAMTGTCTLNGNFSFSDKYEGYVVDGYKLGNGQFRQISYTTNADGSHTYSPASVNTSGNFSVYYKRLEYEIKYLHPDTDESVLGMRTFKYGQSLSAAEPADGVTIDLDIPGYVWDGKWYKDKACTEEFDFENETMPLNGTKVYAGKEKLYYYVKFDPDGGELLTTQRTYSWFEYDQEVEIHNDISRDYVDYKEDGSDPYYYYYDEFDTSRREDIWNGTYMAANPRRAYYTTNNDAGEYQAWLSTKQYSKEVGAYSLIGWYDVTDGGMTPFLTGTKIQKDTVLKAFWRRTGEYSAIYSQDAVDKSGNALMKDGNRVTFAHGRTDTDKYADHSDAVFKDKPTAAAPEGYSFVGWYYNGKVYNPGNAFEIEASIADADKNVYIYPVLEPAMQVVNITFDANGGRFTNAAATEVSAIIAAATSGKSGTYNPGSSKDTSDAGHEKYEITNLQINEGMAILSKAAVTRGITVNGATVEGRGYKLREWNTAADGNGVGYALDSKIGVDGKAPAANTLYAIWDEVFYVYHPSTGKFQTVVCNDSQERYELTNGYDGAKAANPYTTYYYGGYAVYATGAADAAGLTFESGDVKTGTIANTYWTRAKAAKSATAWDKSDTGAVYFLKEVPTAYLAKPKYAAVRENYGQGDISSLYFLSVTDTNIYREGGIKLQGTDTKGSFAQKFTLTQNASGKVDTIEAKSFGNFTGYVTVVKKDGTLAGTYNSCQAYWKTCDNVTVHGVQENIRDITIS